MKRINRSAAAFFAITLMELACASLTGNVTTSEQNLTGNLTTSENPTGNLTTTGNVTGNVTTSEDNKGNVVYSYSEAVVGSDGNAVVSQLTIAKGDDGKYHYLKNDSNGTTTGIWTENLPKPPAVKASLTKITNDITERLEVLNQSIGTRVQDFLKKASAM